MELSFKFSIFYPLPWKLSLLNYALICYCDAASVIPFSLLAEFSTFEVIWPIDPGVVPSLKISVGFDGALTSFSD